MKKLLGIVVISFLLSNSVFADYYELRKCHRSKFISFEKENDKARVAGKWLDDVLTINVEAGTVTRTILRDINNKKETSKILSELAGKNINTNQISQTIFKLDNFAAGYITATSIEEQPGVLQEIKLFISLEKKEFTMQTKLTRTKDSIYGKTGEIGFQSERTFKCDEDFSNQIDEDNIGGSGTAFFVDNKGHLLTNNHVVEGCTLSKISYKNKDYDTKLIATDKTLDLALLKAELKPKSFFIFSKDEAKKLIKVYVAGYPLGKGLSNDLKISSGIVSSLKGFEDNSNEIQIDAPINPGNSGGPIINENGDLVAIAVSGLAKDQTEGINFGIKSSAAEVFLRSNKINPKKSMYAGIKENDKLLAILEEGTVYTYCN